jgi:transposase-like protein
MPSVDQGGEVVDVDLQVKRAGPAAKRFFKKLLRSHGGEPRNFWVLMLPVWQFLFELRYFLFDR